MMGDEYDVSLRVVKQVHGATINECFLFESSASFSVGGVDDCTAAALVERLLSSLDRW